MLVKQNLLFISNRYSIWMTLYRAKAIESNFVFLQVKGAVYKGMSRLVISRGLVPQFFSRVYLLKHNILCSLSKMNTGYGTGEGLQLKQREASFPPLQPNCSEGVGWNSCQNRGHIDGPLSFFRGVCAYWSTAVCAPVCLNHFQIALLQEPDTCVAGWVSL